MKKRRRHQQDPNQLLLFSDEEMSGQSASGGQEAEHPSQETISEAPQASDISFAKETKKQAPPQPLHVMESPDSVVDLLKSVMGLLSQFNDSTVRLIAMQTAALVQRGIDYSLTYRLPSIPDYEFKGDVLAGLAYVSIARSFPNMIESIGLHWEKEYHEAEAAYFNS